jgi:hypothetical protein
MVENMLKEYPNVLTLRVRMPIVADLTYARNFITKIIKYDKVGCTTGCARVRIMHDTSAAAAAPAGGESSTP